MEDPEGQRRCAELCLWSVTWRSKLSAVFVEGSEVSRSKVDIRLSETIIPPHNILVFIFGRIQDGPQTPVISRVICNSTCKAYLFIVLNPEVDHLFNFIQGTRLTFTVLCCNVWAGPTLYKKPDTLACIEGMVLTSDLYPFFWGIWDFFCKPL